jgi:GTPase SAR1 family protein
LTEAPLVLACFDLTRRATLLSVCAWLKAYQKALTVPFEFGLLVGCKADRKADAEVSQEEGQEKAKEVGLDYLEVSSANGDNVEKAFERIARHVSDRYDSIRLALTAETKVAAPVEQSSGREVEMDDD